MRLMRKLEAQGRLDRELEHLPSDAELAERRKEGSGLTRPEAAVLLAYAKMTLYEDLLRTELPDRAYLAEEIAKYFPRPLRRRYAAEIEQHRLKREIVATWIANSVVNRGLAVFVSELEDETGGALDDVLLAYVVARDSFGLLPVWSAIEALPATRAGRACRLALLVVARDVLVRGTRWFMTPRRPAASHRRHGGPLPAGHRRDHGDSSTSVVERGQPRPIEAAAARAMSRPGSSRSWRGPMAGLPRPAGRLRHRVRGAAAGEAASDERLLAGGAGLLRPRRRARPALAEARRAARRRGAAAGTAWR